jgi:serine/threonine-protein kinase
MQTLETNPTQVFRAETPRPGTGPWSTISGYGMLPADFVEKAISRLGWLALFYAIAHPIFRVVEFPGTLLEALSPSQFPLVDIALVGAVLSGGVICALAWSRKVPPALMLDIGLLFEVVGAFWIALVEHGMPLMFDVPFRGVSSVSAWVVFFVLVVPSTLGKTVLAALATACMGPVGLLTSILYYGSAVPAPGRWVQLFFANFLFAAFAIFLSRYVYSLGCDMNKAREMGSYKLAELLGVGGMGEVWRAEHRMLARPAAIKLVRSEICGRTDAQAGTLNRRFEREVQATAALRSPHTVAVYDYGTTAEGCFYYVMELLNGFDLESLVQRFGPLPAERVISFLLQACDSLAEAHSTGMVHRDIKPKNLFVCRLGLNYDFVKVLDFGLVKSALPAEGGQSQLTLDGTTTGTPAYMSPEMALGDKTLDARSDLYSLGCVAYWLLTGRLVFEGNTPTAVLLAHIQNAPVPPSQRAELEIPGDLERVILSCLEKDPARRPQNALELARLLESCRNPHDWNRDRAERWWRTHAPSLAAPSTAGVPVGASS